MGVWDDGVGLLMSKRFGSNQRCKFKIMYPSDHPDPDKAGTKYKPPKNCMVVMSGSGTFFLYDGEPYFPSIRKLSKVLPKYDVVWEEPVDGYVGNLDPIVEEVTR